MYTALSAGCLSHPKGHGQYDTALTALEKCQKSQESPLYNPELAPEKTGMSLESACPGSWHISWGQAFL